MILKSNRISRWRAMNGGLMAPYSGGTFVPSINHLGSSISHGCLTLVTVEVRTQLNITQDILSQPWDPFTFLIGFHIGVKSRLCNGTGFRSVKSASNYTEQLRCLGHEVLHHVCSKTCLVGLLIRSIFRGKNCTNASARAQFFSAKKWAN